MIECQHKRNGLCQLATDMAKTNVLYYEETCVRCAASPNPMAINKIVKGLAASALITQGDTKTASQILKDETWAHSKKRVTGVGSVLSSIFKTIGIVVSEDCSCKRHAVEMDRRGTKWCLENIETIVDWLEEEAKARKLFFFRAGVNLALYGLLRAYLVFENVRHIDKPDPEPERFAKSDNEWAVVVTSAPRPNEYTLGHCLNSIINAGWNDPVVFAEPGIEVPKGITTIHNEKRRGCFHNWLYAAQWALANTTADTILTVQDDAVFHPDSRRFVEDYCLWPSVDTGVISLYTPAHYNGIGTLNEVGINEIYVKVWWGTLAAVWRRESLEKVVNHEITRTWMGIQPSKQADEKHNPALRAQRVEAYFADRRANPHHIANVDYLSGHVLNLIGRRKFFIDPSPVAHISKVSTIGHGGNKGKRNCGRCADHSLSLLEQVTSNINRIEEEIMDSHRGVRPTGQPVIVEPGASVGDTPKHKFMIRTSYADPLVSSYRWNVTEHTLLPSLAAQLEKNFEIELICGPEDPLREEKLAAFNKIAPTTIAPADWYNLPHDGAWRRTTRVDDDDILSIRFTQLIAAIPFDGTECVLIFPTGCLWSESVTYLWEYPENQFLTIQSNTKMTPYHFAHQYYRLMLPTVIVSPEIHWMWVRHHGVLSGATPGAIPRRFTQGVIQTNAELFPYDFPRIQAALAFNHDPIQKVLELRAKHGRYDKDVLAICHESKLSKLALLAEKYKTDKGYVGHGDRGHQYTAIYERLFAGNEDKVEHILEFGVQTGASLRMWSDYFVNAQIHGLDIKTAVVNHPRVVTHKFNSITPLNTHFKFDMVIDDASHKSNHIRIMFGLHGKHVKPGGFYVIEDLHAIRLGGKWRNETPNMLQTCREWVTNPPFGWTCQLYGDQLCVLQKDEV